MMEFTSVEIRQPFSLPATIQVPLYPCLERLETQLQKLNDDALAAASEVASFQQEKASLDYQAELITATSDTFARQAEVRQQLARFESQHATAKAKAKAVSAELESLRHEFAFRLFRRMALRVELAQASQVVEMRAYQLGEKPRRSRLQVLVELDEIAVWLAAWSDDPNLGKESATIQTQLAEARQQQ